MAYRRITVLGPRSTVDVALPADVAVAELAPMLLELLGEPPSAAPVPWRLDGVAGAPLPPAATLAQLGVLDGELLRLGPDLPPPAPPAFDDAPEALAAAVAGQAAGPDAAPAVAGALAVAVVSAGLAGLRGGGVWATVGAAVGVLGAVGLVVGVARAARSTDPGGGAPDTPVARASRTAWALAALPPAMAAGWLALAGPTVVGLLGSAVGAGLAAFAGQAALRVVAPAVLGLLLVALTSAFGLVVAVLTGSPLSAVGTAAALGAILAAPLAPRCALRLAGLRPGDAPPAGAAAQARGHLAGLVVAVAIVAAGGAVLAATTPGWWGPLFAGTTCLVLGLRARGFAEPLPSRVQLVAAVLGAAAITVVAPVPATVRLGLAAVAVAALVGAAALRRPPLGPVGRRTVDLAELAATALSVPLAVAALDLFALVRGW